MYHSFEDPIFKGLMLRYIQAFQNQNQGHVFHLITFEQKAYSLSIKERRITTELLASQNIRWRPITYHTGGQLILFKKGVDFMSALSLVFYLRVRYRIKNLVGFTSVSGVLCWCISKILNMRTIALNIEPHSEYMAEFGLWKRTSLKYRLLRYLELKLLQKGHHVAVPTRNARKDFSKIRSDLYFVPTSIDFNDFSIKTEEGLKLRKELKIAGNKKVVMYVGKFGGIYYSIEEMAEYMKNLAANSPEELFFLIITPDSKDEVTKGFKSKKTIDFHIQPKISFSALSTYLSAADAGLLILPEYPSQRYRCPIKTANYLICGLPIIVNPIVGDEPIIVEKYKVGWVVDLTNPKIDFKNAPSKNQCIEAVRNERDLQEVVDFFNRSLCS